MATNVFSLGLKTNVKNHEFFCHQFLRSNFELESQFFEDGLLGILFFPFLFGFPDQFPGASEVRKNRDETEQKYQSNISGKSWLARVGSVFKSPLWWTSTIGGFADSFLVSAMMGYGMKFLQEQYKISAALAGMGGGVAALGKDTKFYFFCLGILLQV